MHINSFTEWDELKSIMIGHMNTEGDFSNFKGYTNPNSIQHNIIKGPVVKKIANGVKNAIERVCEILDKRNIKVYRPDEFHMNQILKTPWFDSDLVTPTLQVQDRLGVIGNKFIQFSLLDDLALYPFTLQKFYQDLFEAGHTIHAFPKIPDNLVYNDDDEFISNAPYLEGANVLKCGDVLFCSMEWTGNQAGVDYLKHIVGDEFTIVPVTKVKNHIDAHIYFVNDKLMLHDARMDISEIKPWCPSDMKIVPVLYSRIKEQTDAIWPGVIDDDIENTNLLISNSISLSPETIISWNASEEDVKWFKDYGIECLTVPFPEQWLVGFGLHCVTVDIERNGKLRKIFNKNES